MMYAILVSLCVVAQPPPGLLQAINTAVDNAAAHYKTAFSVGVVHDDWEITTQAGTINIDTGEHNLYVSRNRSRSRSRSGSGRS